MDEEHGGSIPLARLENVESCAATAHDPMLLDLGSVSLDHY